MAVEDGYVTENPYHNMYHAADVVQRLVCILRHMGILNTKREGNMRFLTAVIAASVHDFNHPGTNNAFVVRNQGIIAKHYNDQHVIENHSIRMALNMIKDPSMNFLAGSRLGSEEDWIQVRFHAPTRLLFLLTMRQLALTHKLQLMKN
jgi:3',5'-cyclic-nucleotide phosphodiesterase